MTLRRRKGARVVDRSDFTTELRAEVAGRILRGHAAVFNQYAQLPGHLEMLERTAFDKALKDPRTDVRALFNHDPNMLLARQSAGTLRLSTDSEGLEFELDLPNVSYANDLRELVSRGDVSGASFGFIPGADEWRSRDGQRLRVHTSVRALIDVSPVAFPAYEGTRIMLRSNPMAAPEGARSQLIRARARVLFGGK